MHGAQTKHEEVGFLETGGLNPTMTIWKQIDVVNVLFSNHSLCAAL